MNFNKILRYIQHVIYFNICSLSIYLKISISKSFSRIELNENNINEKRYKIKFFPSNFYNRKNLKLRELELIFTKKKGGKEEK